MREEQSAPLANLSAVNYGNLPSCLSAFAASPPLVSKSKAWDLQHRHFLIPTRAHTALPDDGWHLQHAQSWTATAKTIHTEKTHKTGAYDLAWEAKPSETAAQVSISNSIVRVSACRKTRCTKHLCNNCWILTFHKNKYMNKNTYHNNSTEGAKIHISDKSNNLLDIFSVIENTSVHSTGHYAPM